MNNPYLRYLIVFLGAIFLQATIVPLVEIASWKPDLVLVTLVLFAIQKGPNAGSTAGFITGIFTDIINGTLLGLGSFSKSITGFIAAHVARYFHERSQFIFTLFISGFIHDVVFILINTLGRKINWQVMIFAVIIPNLLYTAIIGIAVHFSLGRWLKENEQY